MVIPTHRVIPPSSAISPGNNLADTPTGVSPQQFLIQSSSSKLIIALAFPILASLLGRRVKSAYSKWPSLYFPWSTHDPWRQGHYVVSKFCRTKQWVYQTRDKRPNPRKATSVWVGRTQTWLCQTYEKRFSWAVLCWERASLQGRSIPPGPCYIMQSLYCEGNLLFLSLPYRLVNHWSKHVLCSRSLPGNFWPSVIVKHFFCLAFDHPSAEWGMRACPVLEQGHPQWWAPSSMSRSGAHGHLTVVTRHFLKL